MRLAKHRTAVNRDARLRTARYRELPPREEGGGGGGVVPVLFTPLTSSALSNLSQSLTINGTTKQPTYLYLGKDAGPTEWVATVGENLPVVTVAAAPVQKPTPTMALSDRTVHFTSDYYLHGTVAYGEIGTDDAVFEIVVVDNDTGANKEPVLNSAGGGVALLYNSAARRYFSLHGAGSTKIVGGVGGAVQQGAVHHMMLFIDASGSAQIFVDGVADGAAVSLSGMGALTNAAALALGNGANAGIAWAAMWQGASWLDTHSQAALAAERFARLTSDYATTGSVSSVPSTAARASVATLYRWNETLNRVELFTVDSGWMRICSSRDPINKKVIKGYLAELAATNIIPYGVDISNAAWTKSGMSVSATVVTPPDQSPSAVSVMHENNAAAAQHRMYDAAPMTSGEDYVVSFYAKALGRTWVAAAQNVNAGYVRVSFDLSNGTVGTVVDASGYYVGSGMQNCGDGWYRCWIATTGQSTTTNESLLVYIAAGDNVTIFDGLDQDSVAIWGIQTELGAKPSSLIKTDGASAVRVKDSLEYATTTPAAGKGTLYAEHRTATAAGRVLTWSLDNSNLVQLYAASGNGSANCLNGASTQFGITDVVGSMSDDKVHSRSVSWETNDAEHTLDGAVVGTDSSVSGPTGLNKVAVGSTRTFGSQPGGLVSNVIVYDEVVDYATIASLLEDAEMASYGELYVTTPLTVDVTLAGAPAKLGSKAGVSAAGDLLNFTHTDPGRLTYTGTATAKFRIVAAINMESDTINTLSEVYAAKNGAVLTESKITRLIAGATDEGALSVSCLVELATGDYVELFADADKTAELTSNDCNLSVVELT